MGGTGFGGYNSYTVTTADATGSGTFRATLARGGDVRDTIEFTITVVDSNADVAVVDLRDSDTFSALERNGYDLEPGQQVTFILHENPSTGYTWQ